MTAEAATHEAVCHSRARAPAASCVTSSLYDVTDDGGRSVRVILTNDFSRRAGNAARGRHVNQVTAAESVRLKITRLPSIV